MKSIGVIRGGQLDFPLAIVEERRKFLTKLKDTTLVEETLEVYKEPKTAKQVKTIFGLMIKDTIIQANDLGIDVSYLLKYLINEHDPKGQGLTEDFLHELMYVICPTTDADGKRTTLSKMNTTQAANLFERYRNIISPLGIYIPDPNPNWQKEKDNLKT